MEKYAKIEINNVFLAYVCSGYEQLLFCTAFFLFSQQLFLFHEKLLHLRATYFCIHLLKLKLISCYFPLLILLLFGVCRVKFLKLSLFDLKFQLFVSFLVSILFKYFLICHILCLWCSQHTQLKLHPRSSICNKLVQHSLLYSS